MMKLRYSPNQRMTFECEVANSKQAFEAVANIQAVFEHGECGCCKSKAVRFDARDWDGNRYYKMVCQACNAQLDFGQHKEGGGLFVKNWDKEMKRPMPNGGWYVYQQGTRSGGGSSGGQRSDNRQPAHAGANQPDEHGNVPF